MNTLFFRITQKSWWKSESHVSLSFHVPRRHQTLVSSGVTLKVSKGGELQAHIACHATNINSGLSALIMYAIFIAQDLSLRNSLVVVALPGSVVRRMPLHSDAHSLHVSMPGASRSAPWLVWWCVAAGWLRLVQACHGSCFPALPRIVLARGASFTTSCHDFTLFTQHKRTKRFEQRQHWHCGSSDT